MSRGSRREFWSAVRRDYAALWPEIRRDWREAREEWWDLIAGWRQERQMARRMWLRVTGQADPARTERRRAGRAVLAEAAELEEIGRRVVREHDRGGGAP